MNTAIPSIPLAQLRPSKTEAQTQRRKYFDKAKLAELAESVKAHGVLQPIIVRNQYSIENGDHYEIVAGERRYVAAKNAGLERIPANVLELTDEQVIEVQLIENLQREDIHPMQEAEGYHELVNVRRSHTAEDLAARVGKSRTYVYNRMKLTALSEKCRKAFYADKISASIAEKLARIPVPKTQDEALAQITRDDWSYRRAAEIIQDNYMMKLAEAPFPKDVKLGGAGPCGTCLKRTGNQPELFGDIKSADVCTDTVCFAAKIHAHSQQLAEAARARGQPVLTGKAAARVAPNGVHGGGRGTYIKGDFVALDDEEYVGGRHKKVSSLVGKDVERTLVVDDKTGRSIEVVPRSALPKEARGDGDYNALTGGSRSAEKKAALEKKVLSATYAALRPKLKAASLFEIAGSLFRRLEHDATKLLCKVRGFEQPTRNEKYRGKVTDYAAIGKALDKLSDADLQLFINDCIYVHELAWPGSSYRDVGIPKIADLAKKHRVDVAKIRAELAPKKTKSPKSPKKSKRRGTGGA